MNSNQKPIQTFREGAIGVSIWQGDGREGPFFDFTLSRSYKRSEDEAGYTGTFHAYNEEAISTVVRQACEWIREHSTDTDAERQHQAAA